MQYHPITFKISVIRIFNKYLNKLTTTLNPKQNYMIKALYTTTAIVHYG